MLAPVQREAKGDKETKRKTNYTRQREKISPRSLLLAALFVGLSLALARALACRQTSDASQQ